MNDKYEFKEKKIEELRIQVENLEQLTLKEDEEIKKLVEDKIQNLLPEHKLYFHFDVPHSPREWREWYIDMGFIDEKGEEDFSSHFHIYIYLNPISSIRKKSIYINCGTKGEWCVEDDPYQYYRILLMKLIVENKDDLFSFFQDLNKKQIITPVYERLNKEFKDMQDDLYWEKEKDLRNSIKEKIVPNTEIDFGGRLGRIKITKVTPKRVYFEKYSYADKNYWAGYKYFKPLDEIVELIHFDIFHKKGEVTFLNTKEVIE